MSRAADGSRNGGLEAPDTGPLRSAAESVARDGRRVTAWSFFTTATRRFRVGARDGVVAGAHAPVRIGESAAARYLLVWDDDRVSRGTLERARLGAGASETLARSRETAIDDPDAAHVRGPDAFPEVALWDDDCAAFADGARPREVASPILEAERIARAVGVETWSGSVGASAAASRLTTSAGLDVAGRGTSYGWNAALGGLASDGASSRRPDDADAIRSRLERLAATYVRLRESADPPAPGIRPVLLHPHVVESFVLGVLFHNLAGATVDHGEGAFALADFGSGHAVIRDDLTVRIDPLQPYRSGSYRFTTEGVPAAAAAFVERGRLVMPVLDVKYAARLRRSPTPLPVAWDTVSLEGPDTLGEPDAIEASDASVLSVLGVHTQDFGSGDFSLSAPQVLRHRSGDRRGRIRGTIAGNVFELLRSDDLRLVRFEGETTPGLLVRCRLDAERP